MTQAPRARTLDKAILWIAKIRATNALSLALALRKIFPAPITPDIRFQAAIFIDPANVSGNASDANDGVSLLTPLRTYREYWRRMMTASYAAGISRVTLGTSTQQRITLMSDCPDTDPIFADMWIPAGSTWTVAGAVTVVRTGGRFTAFSYSPPANQPLWITDAANGFAASDRGRLLVDTTRGAVQWVQQIRSATQIESSQPFAPIADPAFLFTVPTMIAEANGDAYEIHELTSCLLGDFHIDGLAADSATGAGAGVACIYRLWGRLRNTPPEEDLVFHGTASFALVESKFDAFTGAEGTGAIVTVLNCFFFNECVSANDATMYIVGGFSYFGYGAGRGGFIHIDGNAAFVNRAIQSGAGRVSLGLVQMNEDVTHPGNGAYFDFRSMSNCAYADPLPSYYGQAALWGTTPQATQFFLLNAGSIVRVFDPATFAAEVTLTSARVVLGGLTSLPPFLPASGAYAAPAGYKTTTPANFNPAAPGGFGGSMWNPFSQCGLVSD